VTDTKSIRPRPGPGPRPGPTPTPTHSGARRAAHPALVLLIIAGAQLMVVLDATIVNVALPTMANHFDKSQVDMTWAINAYSLAFGGLLLLGGRSGDILGKRRMFAVGLGLFTFGSLLAGMAPNFGLLLAGRVVQGLGGAIAAPTALSLIAVEFEEGKARNRAIAVYAAVSGAGAALGLLLGGILTEWAGWRWIFFVNIPIGIVLITGAFFYIHEAPRITGRFDVLGALLSVAGMTTLVYAFIHVAHDGWSNGQTVLLFGLAIVLLVGFVLYEAFGAESPMMPLRIFENRSRAGGYLVMLVVGAAMFGMFLYVSFFIQGVLEYSALKTGLAFLPFPFTVGITSQIAARLLPRLGPKVIITFGTSTLTLGMIWMSRVSANTQYFPDLLFPLLVLAFSMACLFVPLTVVATSKVADRDQGLASALLNVGQQVGGALGVSILASVFATGAKNEGKHQAAALAADKQHLSNLDVLSGASQGLKTSPNLHIPITPGTVSTAHSDNVAVQAIHAVQAHGSAVAFLTAAIMAGFAVLVAALVIQVKKSDLPDEVSPETLVAA
jgi:EmrB/QacA subfamily drug resistance transporter